MTATDASSKLVRFPIEYSQDESGVWSALIPSVEGCGGCGETLCDAKVDALEGLLVALSAADDPTKLPDGRDREAEGPFVQVDLSAGVEALSIYKIGFRIRGARLSQLQGFTHLFIGERELVFHEVPNHKELIADHVGLSYSDCALYSAFQGAPEFLRARFFLSSGLRVHISKTGYSRKGPNGRWACEVLLGHTTSTLTSDLFEDDETYPTAELNDLASGLALDKRYLNLVDLAAEAEDFLEMGNYQVAIMVYSLVLDTIANLDGTNPRAQWRQKLDDVIDLAGLPSTIEDERNQMVWARHHVCHDSTVERPRCFLTSAYLFRKVLRRAIPALARKNNLQP